SRHGARAPWLVTAHRASGVELLGGAGGGRGDRPRQHRSGALTGAHERALSDSGAADPAEIASYRADPGLALALGSRPRPHLDARRHHALGAGALSSATPSVMRKTGSRLLLKAATGATLLVRLRSEPIDMLAAVKSAK